MMTDVIDFLIHLNPDHVLLIDLLINTEIMVEIKVVRDMIANTIPEIETNMIKIIVDLKGIDHTSAPSAIRHHTLTDIIMVTGLDTCHNKTRMGHSQ